jgi:hypothetical protein
MCEERAESGFGFNPMLHFTSFRAAFRLPDAMREVANLVFGRFDLASGGCVSNESTVKTHTNRGSNSEWHWRKSEDVPSHETRLCKKIA